MEKWQPIYWCHLECAENYKSLLISGHLTGTGWNILAVTQALSQGADSLKYVLALKLTCGFLDRSFRAFSGSVQGIIVCSVLDPCLYAVVGARSQTWLL